MKKHLLIFFVIATAIVAVDQITKALIVKQFFLHESRPIIPGFFNLTYVRNTGAAFGIFAGHESWRHFFFLTIGLITLTGLFVFFIKNHDSKLILFGSCLVFGGAIGNIIDRLKQGYVIDFLDFFIDKYHWPAFNVADSAISIGTFLLAIYFLKQEKKKKN